MNLMELLPFFLSTLGGLISGVLILIAFALFRRKEEKQLITEAQFKLKRAVRQQVLPLRLSAYERCLLFVERCTPQNLIPRSDALNKTVRQFHLQLVQEIRAEFEHNLTQQLYISENAWSEIVSMREAVITLIHKCATALPENAPAHELARKVLEQSSLLPTPISYQAISILKAEVKSLF
jgi:hypothetical protein